MPDEEHLLRGRINRIKQRTQKNGQILSDKSRNTLIPIKLWREVAQLLKTAIFII